VGRSECSHETVTSTITVIRWCVRCSGWRYFSWGESLAGPWDMSPRWSEVTSGFWPAEETFVTECQSVIQRILRVSQEGEQDAHAQ